MFLFDRIHHQLRFHILAEVDHIVIVVLQQHFHDILADIVNIAFDGGEHDLSFFDRLLPHLAEVAANRFKPFFGRIRAHQQLRQEDGSVFKALAHLVQCRYQMLLNNIQRRYIV